MSSKSKSDKSKKSRKKNTSSSNSTTLNLSPVVEAGEDDDAVDNSNNNNYYYHHRRRLGEDDRRWDQRHSSSSSGGGGILLGPLPFSTDDGDGTLQQPQRHSPSSSTYAHATTINNDDDSNMISSTTTVARSPPPSPGMMYCQNIIAEEDTIPIQTEERELDFSSGRGRYYNTNSSSSSTHNTNSHYNPFPLKNFEEADLLQRAIERRAYLHDRIVAMEAAKYKLLDEGGNASSSSSGQRRTMAYPPRGEESSESFPTRAIQYPTPPLQVVDDDRQQSTIPSTTSIRRGQRQRQRPHHPLEETTSVQPESSSRYQSTSMRHPPPTAETQSPGERTMDDPLDYNQKNGHLPFDEDGDDSSGGGGGDGEGMETFNDPNSYDTNITRSRMSDHRHHHQRMTEISQRIKKEALEFMSYESSYAEKLAQQLEGVRRSKYLDGGLEHNRMNGSSSSFVNEEGSDHEDDENDFNDQISSSPIGSKTRSSRNQGLANELPLAGQQQQQQQQQQRSSPSKVDSAATIDSSAWSGSGKNPTPQQLSRYSNMVRLGIPDVAVIRSMERDGMSNSQSILESLKEEHGIPLSSSSATDIMSESSSSVDMPYVRQSSLVSNSSSSNNITSPEEGDDGKDDGKQVATPLRDDPHYSKYFKMLKAKVPPSWVKRVLEVDGKNSRVLDLDPNLPLAEQLPGAVDKLGNIDWGSVNLDRSASSSHSVEHSDVDNKVVVDTLASVKAEIETMRAKAGEMTDGLRKVPSDESLPDVSSKGESTTNPATTSAADICSAAVAASNSRLIRLNALRAAGGGDKSSDGLGVKRRTIDEIRRRPPQPSPSTNRHTIPRPSPKSSKAGASTKQSYADLPLKDDPRFSKYFQMIRSRVPRSWVERVIEVDDRDPAILDLDPNKSLASQIGEESAGESDTIASTAPSIDASGTSGFSRNTRNSFPTSILDERNKVDTIDEVAGAMPPNQIFDYKNDDDKSDASSITTFREIQGDKSTIDATRLLSVLDRIESQLADQGVVETSKSAEIPAPPRFTDADEVERRLTELIEKFGTKKSVEARTDMSNEQRELMEKSQAIFTKLSALLSNRIGLPDNGDVQKPPEHSSLESLPVLLTQVLEKLEKISVDDVTDSNKESDNKRPEREQGAQPPILCEDPEYSKYFKMLKLGLPRTAVIQALERDGQDVAVLDMDPNRPFTEQKSEAVDEQPKAEKNAELKALFAKRVAGLKDSNKNAALEALFAKRSGTAHQKGSAHQEGTAPILKDDPEFQKYMRMLKVGMPKEKVRQALERDGKDQTVADMDPDKTYASQVRSAVSEPPLSEDEEYAKFFKMLKMGVQIGAVRQALQKEGKDPNIIEMDPTKSYASQKGIGFGSDDKAANPALKDDPEFSKFFKMLKLGIPPGGVRQALQKEGKDPNIVDMDPEKSYLSQVKGNACIVKIDAEPLLKDDPELGKFFKMLKMGMPLGAVQNALKKEGRDANIINLDPEKPMSRQLQPKVEETKKEVTKLKGGNVARKRIHWNKIDESKLSADSFWNQAKEHSSLQLVGLDFDNEEFASLFTSPVKNHSNSEKPAAAASKVASKQKVQLIDGRRRMNGSILLTKFKVDYKTLARQVNAMEYIEAEGNELRGMLQLLPTKDESLALRSYLPPQDAPQSEIDEAIAKLGECEQYMAVMLDVPDVKDKFQCMVFRAEFVHLAESIKDGTKLLIEACESVKNSERFRKVLLYALKLGNALNTGGANEEVTAITLDSLLKLAEAKAFDRQTSVLHYLVSIVQKNDEDVLKLSDDFVPVKAAERVSMEMLAQQLKEVQQGIELVKNVAKRHLPDSDVPVVDLPDDDILAATPMGQFALSASSTTKLLANDYADVKSNFADLLQFFGEETTMTPEVFFCTINTFVSLFDQTHKELKRKEEAKERKKRIEERKKLREQEVAAKK